MSIHKTNVRPVLMYGSDTDEGWTRHTTVDRTGMIKMKLMTGIWSIEKTRTE